MAALVDGGGRLLAANRALSPARSGAPTTRIAGRPFAELLATGADDFIRLAAESESADPLRLVQLPLDESDPGDATVFLLLDEDGARGDPARARAAPPPSMSTRCWRCCRWGWRWPSATAASCS